MVGNASTSAAGKRANLDIIPKVNSKLPASPPIWTRLKATHLRLCSAEPWQSLRRPPETQAVGIHIRLNAVQPPS